MGKKDKVLRGSGKCLWLLAPDLTPICHLYIKLSGGRFHGVTFYLFSYFLIIIILISKNKFVSKVHLPNFVRRILIA